MSVPVVASEPERNAHQLEQLLTREEAGRIMRKKVSWLRYSERHRLIPFVKVGQAVRYRASDLLAWIEAHVVRDRASGGGGLP